MGLFLIRNPIRDRWKDCLRLHKLTMVLSALGQDIAKEHDGLQRRYETAQADAAFSMNAMEDPNVSFGGQVNIDGMSESLSRYSRRIAQIEAQFALVENIQSQVTQFIQEHDIDRIAKD